MTHTKSSGTLKQQFTLKINIDKLIDKIVSNVIDTTESIINNMTDDCEN